MQEKKCSMLDSTNYLGKITMIKIIRNLSIATALVFLAACVSAPVSPGVGAWDVNVNTPLGDQASVWTIAADGTGSMAGEQGEQLLEGIMLDGNSISFSVDIDAGGQSLSMSFTGTVDGDSLSGEFDTDFGAFGVTGTRQ